MSERDWIKYAKFGAVALIFVFIASVLASLPKPESKTSPDKFADLAWNCDQEKGTDNQTNQKPSDGNMSIRVGDIVIEQNFTANRDTDAKQQCIDNKRGDSDLRAQWLAADSARNSYSVAYSSYVLGIVNFVALVLTLVAAGVAAWYAREQSKTARNSLETLERPHLTIKTIKPPPKPEPFDCTKQLTFQLVNFGRSHAIITHVHVGIQPVWKVGEDGFADPERIQGRAIGRGLVVPPGESDPFLAPVWLSEDNPTFDLAGQGGYLHGFVRYEDAFGKRHVTGFALLYVESSRSFHIPITHDKNANYSRSDEAAVRLAEPIGE